METATETAEPSAQFAQSPELGALAAALAKAQAGIEGALKDSANPFFKSSYADLESVWSACRGPLTENGLAVVQTTEPVPDGVQVVTTLLHASGQWMRGRLHMRPVKNDPQGIGSCITYARRYALAAMVGVYQTDDDGEGAHGRGKDKNGKGADPNALPEPRRAGGNPPAPDAAKDFALEGESAEAKFGKFVTQGEISNLMGAIDRAGVSSEALKTYMQAQWGVASRKDLRKGHLVEIHKWIVSATTREPGAEG